VVEGTALEQVLSRATAAFAEALACGDFKMAMSLGKLASFIAEERDARKGRSARA
jgi:hypothetical protein